MGDDSEWMKLPIDQKCEHKVNALSFSLCLFLSCCNHHRPVTPGCFSISSSHCWCYTEVYTSGNTLQPSTSPSAVSSTMCWFCQVSNKPHCCNGTVVVPGPASVGLSVLFWHCAMQDSSSEFVGASVTPPPTTRFMSEDVCPAWSPD